MEPALQGTSYGRYYAPSDFAGDIHKFTNGLAAACEHLGTEGVTVTNATIEGDGVGEKQRSLIQARCGAGTFSQRYRTAASSEFDS